MKTKLKERSKVAGLMPPESRILECYSNQDSEVLVRRGRSVEQDRDGRPTHRVNCF